MQPSSLRHSAGDRRLIPKVQSQRGKISKDHRLILFEMHCSLKSKTRLNSSWSVDLAMEGHYAVSAQHRLKIYKWKPKTEGAKSSRAEGWLRRRAP